MKVSVIITCYNLADYIDRATRSCLNQTLPEEEFEVIVVDDASTDYSRKIITGLGHFVKPIFLEKNVGVAEASNIGIEKAKGKYIIRVDGDDYINRNILFIMSEILEWNDDIGFVYCDQIKVDEGEERRVEINTLEKLLNNGAGVMFRKSYLESIGLYDPKLRTSEDYDLILRYMKNFNGYHLRLPYYRYFQREGSLSKSPDRATLQSEIRGRQCRNSLID